MPIQVKAICFKGESMKILTFILILIVYSGCVPMVYGPYYQPTYDDNSTVSLNGVCSGKGTIGPSSGIEFEIPSGILVDFRTQNGMATKGDMFNIVMKIPSGVNAQFLADDIIVKYPDSTENKQKKLMEVNGDKRAESDMVYQFEKFCPVSERNGSINLSLWSWSKNINTIGSFNQLEMILPKILVNGTLYSLKPIIIHPYRTGTNEYSDRSYKECMRISPSGRCVMSYILYAEKFEERVGTSDFSGRAYWLQEKESNHIEVNLAFRTSTSRTFKFVSNKISFIDSESNSTIDTKLDFVDVHCNNKSLPLTTPIEGLYSNLSIFIDGTLGGKNYSEMDVYLPAMSINGQIYNFKPIHVKRIIIDGGLLPFNC